MLTTEYVYKDSAGAVLGTITRLDFDDGAKTFRASEGFPKPRPLFNLDQLVARPDAPVLIVEGKRRRWLRWRCFLPTLLSPRFSVPSRPTRQIGARWKAVR